MRIMGQFTSPATVVDWFSTCRRYWFSPPPWKQSDTQISPRLSTCSTKKHTLTHPSRDELRCDITFRSGRSRQNPQGCQSPLLRTGIPSKRQKRGSVPRSWRPGIVRRKNFESREVGCVSSYGPAWSSCCECRSSFRGWVTGPLSRQHHSARLLQRSKPLLHLPPAAVTTGFPGLCLQAV